MKARLLVVLLLAVLAAADAKPFEAVVTGWKIHGCRITPLADQTLEWVKPDDWEFNTKVRAIASSDGTRVLAILTGNPYSVASIGPYGVREPFATGSGSGVAIAVADDGRVYVLASTTGFDWRLDRFSASGTLQASYPLGPRPLPITGLDVASDGCTIFYAHGITIDRFDGCTGTPLPTFATNIQFLNDIEVQPDGQVLVATEGSVLLYTAAGALSRTVATLSAYGFDPNDYSIDEASVRDGVLWMTPNNSCSEGNLLRVSFPDGAELSRRELEVVNRATGLVIGDAAQANIPTMGEIALTLLAFALAAAGALVLRLR